MVSLQVGKKTKLASILIWGRCMQPAWAVPHSMRRDCGADLEPQDMQPRQPFDEPLRSHADLVHFDASDPKWPWDSSTGPEDSNETAKLSKADAGGITGAPPLWTSERLGSPRPADCGTLGCLSQGQAEGRPSPLGKPCSLLGGGKRGRTDEVWIDESELDETPSPGRLQDRLLVLQAKAKEALPAECREDWDYMVWWRRVSGVWRP